VMFSVVTKYHKGRHSLFLYNSEIFYAFTQDILRSHQHGKWRVNSEKHTLKLGKKLKKNKTFTLSKKADKNGYRTLTTLDQYNKYVMKVKRVKVHNKTKLKMITKFSDNSKRTDMFFPVTKKIINTDMY